MAFMLFKEYNPTLLPETALRFDDCFESDRFLFRKQAKKISSIIGDIVKDESKSENTGGSPIYQNNVIGVLGGRGSGKTSLIQSVFETIKHAQKNNDTLGRILCLQDAIDPKTLPNDIGIVDLVLGRLYSWFVEMVKDPESSIDDGIIADIQNRFEELNLHLAMASNMTTRDPLENPSDIYNISKLTNIRKDLEAFVSHMLERLGLADRYFAIAIDDFDLDSKNCYRMASDIITYLTINHLIIFIAMDEEIFLNEIIRARFTEISNYGYAASRYLASSESDDGGIYALSNAAEKYAQQLFSKMMPISRRVYLNNTPSDFLYSQAIKETFFWLIGNDVSAIRSPTLSSSFKKSFDQCPDLRIKNQSLNYLRRARPINDKVISNQEWIDQLLLVKEVFAQLAATLDSVYKTRPTTVKPWMWNPKTNFFHTIVEQINAIEIGMAASNEFPSVPYIVDGLRDIIISDEKGTLSFSTLFGDEAKKHPLAYFAFEYYVDALNPYDRAFCQKYITILNVFVPGVAREEDGIIHIQDRMMEIEDFARQFRGPNLSSVRQLVAKLTEDLTRIKKYDLENLCATLDEYMHALPERPADLVQCNVALKAALQQPWKTADDRSERRAEINGTLRKLELLLNREPSSKR